MDDAGRSSTIMHLLVKRYVPIRVEHIGILILRLTIWLHMICSYELCTYDMYDILMISS